MTRRRGRISETDVDVVEKAGDLVTAIDNKLTASSHAAIGAACPRGQGRLDAAEIAMGNVLIGS